MPGKELIDRVPSDTHSIEQRQDRKLPRLRRGNTGRAGDRLRAGVVAEGAAGADAFRVTPA
eukprot:13476099-Alexandrium_andersonii.AAC.1